MTLEVKNSSPVPYRQGMYSKTKEPTVKKKKGWGDHRKSLAFNFSLKMAHQQRVRQESNALKEAVDKKKMPATEANLSFEKH
ncbi:hypothetical protein CEXT_182961 [Caerostris extrusa]|uniref:Uncharacterized protein n=1 Tax=Caerostris extrusa TaxID=172846 RepID=A0AAV4RTU4_CAEEX|nr:hypothetical protein CEXT_182961 [Caerostris extrusa]